jgi:type IV secretion system protein VirB4
MIVDVIWWLIVVIIVALLGYMMFERSRPYSTMREYRTRFRGLPDLLNYGVPVADGVFMGKDGSLMAGWIYSGEDMDSASDSERAGLAHTVNRALARRGTSWMYHIDAFREPVSGYPAEGFFRNKTAWLFDEERRRQISRDGARYASEYGLFVTYLPPADAEAQAVDYLIEGRTREERADALARTIASFEAGLREIEDVLLGTLQMHRLKTTKVTDDFGGEHLHDELLAYVIRCLTGEKHDIVRSPQMSDLDGYLGARDFFVGYKPRLGTEFGVKHIRPVAIIGFPSESYPGILDNLNRIGVPYRWSTRFIPLDTSDANRELDRIRKQWAQKRTSLRNAVRESQGGVSTHDNLDAVRMRDDTIVAMGEASEGVVKFGYYTPVVIIMGDSADEADSYARDVVKIITNAGFTARVEELNAVEAFLGSLPGHGYYNVRRPIIHTANLADLLSISGMWPGRMTAPAPKELLPENSPPLALCATSGATPFALNLHVDDVGHTLIVGPTGSGKSVFLSFLALQFQRYEFAQIFMFDKGYSSFVACNASGGAFYDVGAAGEMALYPLAHVDEPSEREWAQTWIENIVKLVTKSEVILPYLKRAIADALVTIANSPPERRTLGEFAAQLQDPDNILKGALHAYTKGSGSIVGDILDGGSDSVADTSFVVFEMQNLKTLSKEAVAPLLLAIFHRIERELRDNLPTLVILDEAWLMLDNPIFQETIREWLKVLRKANASVVFATQSPNDVLTSPIADTIIEACMTKIFLPNVEADKAIEAYRKLGRTDGQINRIKHAQRKKEYFYTSVYGARWFDLMLGPVGIAFCAQSNSDRVSKVRELMEIDREIWPAAWLEYLGHPLEARAWLTLEPSRLIAESMFGDMSQVLALGRGEPALPQAVNAPSLPYDTASIDVTPERPATLFVDVPLPNVAALP